jgi:hypothetical protein
MPGLINSVVSAFTAAATGDSENSNRLAARDAAKAEIRQRQSILAEAAILQSRADDLDREADAAADRHSEATQPLQSKLRQLPLEDEAKRRELMLAVEDENEKLSDTVERIRRLKGPLTKRIRELQNEAAEFATAEIKLSRDLADPELWNQRFAAGEISKVVQGLIRACDAHIREAEGRAELSDKAQDKVQAALYRARVGKWQETRRLAVEVVAEFEAKAKQLNQQILSE